MRWNKAIDLGVLSHIKKRFRSKNLKKIRALPTLCVIEDKFKVREHSKLRRGAYQACVRPVAYDTLVTQKSTPNESFESTTYEAQLSNSTKFDVKVVSSSHVGSFDDTNSSKQEVWCPLAGLTYFKPAYLK